MNSYILCSPQHAFLGVIGLFLCGLFTAEALQSSTRGAESLAASHQLARSVEGGATLASADVPHYYR
jgi:ammonia channel protein AmtB